MRGKPHPSLAMIDMARALLPRQQELIRNIPVFDDDGNEIGYRLGEYLVPEKWIVETRSKVPGDGEVIHLIRRAFDGGRWR